MRSPAGALPPVDILDTSKKIWTTKLLDILEFDPKSKGFRPLKEVLEVALQKLKSRFILVENYISTDYADEYAHHHARIFQDRSRVCKRLHFFAQSKVASSRRLRVRFRTSDLLALPDDLRAAYLGYSVVRPLQSFRVGHTVLKSPHLKGTADLVHCQARFKANLFGETLEVFGMPFMQQDVLVTVCAEAALWMVALYMYQIGEARRYRPSEITELAKRHMTVGSTREGLAITQMVDALRLMDLTPHYITPADVKDAVELLYTSVESELPVIVGIPEHVQTVIGHGFRDPLRAGSGLDSLARLVDAFIAHDDAVGPYQRLRVGKTIIRGETGRPIRTCLTLAGKPVEECIVVLPPRVHLRAEDASDIARLWLSKAHLFFPEVWRRRELQGIVFRVYLRRSDQFKADVAEASRGSAPMDPLFASVYRSCFFPRYLWIVELSYTRDINGKSPQNRFIRGELILDATAAHYDFDRAILAHHLNGKLMVRVHPERGPLQYGYYSQQSEKPYVLLRRSVAKSGK